MDAATLAKTNAVTERIPEPWSQHLDVRYDDHGLRCEIHSGPESLPELCTWIAQTLGYSFAGLIVEQQPREWLLRYLFYGAEAAAGWIHVLVEQPLVEPHFRSISEPIHAADWHEREAEDLFGLVFEGHPRLGDFVLHDDAWQEGLAPMRREFNAHTPPAPRVPDASWRPHRIVHAPGVFAMPIGPVYSGVSESAHFLLETVGEDVIRAMPRLFYKYRAVEKIAEGRSAEDVLLLAERFSGVTAFAHAFACVQAIETIGGIEVPPRARTLRVLLAELERLRHHIGAIQEICESTALMVAASQAGVLEEEMLRVCGALTGHRYLFGLVVPGGLSRDFEWTDLRGAVSRSLDIVQRLASLEARLVNTSSFLDRLEEVGVVTEDEAHAYGLVGPIARASGVASDLRKVQPYSGYSDFVFDVPRECEGDGYARLRILFAEARQAMRIVEQAVVNLPDGPIRAAVSTPMAGAALGWTEAPIGAAFHWIRLDERGRVQRYRIIPPSFVNWHAFHLAAEAFAFQDFPIILASFGLSVAENDR
jgi:formate hydrogenlyase subunit 5